MKNTKSKKNKIIGIIKKILPIIGILIFIYIINLIGPNKIFSTLFNFSPIILLLVITLIFLTLLLKNYIWQIILDKQKVSISFFKSLKLILIGRFYGIITPGNLGTYAKVIYLKEETDEPTGKLFVNIIIFQVIDCVAFYIIVLISAILFASENFEIFILVFVYISIMSIIYLIFINKERGEKIINFFIKIFIPKKLKTYFTNFSYTFYKDFPKIKELLYPFGISFIVQISEYTYLYILAIFLGIDISFPLFIVLFTIAAILATMPISIGGLGTREAALILLFTPFGIAAHKLVAFSLMIFIISLFFAFIGFILAIIESKNKKKTFKLKEISFKS